MTDGTEDDKNLPEGIFDDEVDDEEPVGLEGIHQAFVTDTDWTTETILSQMRRGNIHLNPRFQRRDAWDRKRKSRFIESLILGLPIPQLVLAEDRTRKGSFIVLDGKQRLLTLSQFSKNSSFGESENRIKLQLKLIGTEILTDLKGKTLVDLESTPEMDSELNAFLNQTIRTVVVRNWPNEDFLNLVFLRLNTGSVQLSPQELRQALHPGPFTDFLDDYASESLPLRRALNLRSPDFRMRDVEILLRFFAVALFLENYSGNLKLFLDETSDKLNSAWEKRSDEIERVAREFDLGIESAYTEFGSDTFRRWTPERGGFENRFNRAIFEIVVYYLINPQLRDWVAKNPTRMREAFIILSRSSPSFANSLTATTKTVESFAHRLGEWGEALRELSGVKLSVPYYNQETSRLELRQ